MLAVCAVVTACGGGEEAAELSGPLTDRAPSFEAPQPTTTVAPAVVAPGLPSTSTTGAPARSTTTTRAGGPSTTQAARAVPLSPMAPGTYRYDTVGQSTIGTAVTPFPAVTAFVADTPAGGRQHGVRDLRDPSRNGPVLDSTFEYRPDGLYLVDLRTAITVLVFTATGGLLPPTPVLLLPTGAGPGYHQELDVPTETSTAHLALDVVRREPVTVAGRAVDTTVIRLRATLPGQYNARLDLTIWLSAEHRVWAREHLVADASAAGVSYHAEYDATLQRLTPS
jgi:hypothetical protein